MSIYVLEKDNINLSVLEDICYKVRHNMGGFVVHFYGKRYPLVKGIYSDFWNVVTREILKQKRIECFVLFKGNLIRIADINTINVDMYIKDHYFSLIQCDSLINKEFITVNNKYYMRLK
ncbi:MAG: hypothetical protein K2G70_07670 [Turicibacter sp.]|nr:hypothetical protein [Turicibacter sp.]